MPGERDGIPEKEPKQPDERPRAKKKGKPRGRPAKKGERVGGAAKSAEERDQVKWPVRRKAFALTFLKTWDANEALREIGLQPCGQNASRYLKHPEVQAIIAEEMQKRCADAKVTEARVIAELTDVAFSSMKDYAEWNADGVRLVSSADLTRDMCRSIQSIKSTHTRDGVNVSFKLHDKLKALEQLGRILGMFKNEEGKDRLQPLQIMQMLQEFSKQTKDLATEDARTVDGGKEPGNG